MSNDQITVTLPVWIPLTNLVLSVAGGLALLSLTLVAIRRRTLVGRVTLILTAVVWSATIVLIGGALSQLGILSEGLWLPIGTIGRLVFAIGLITLATFDDVR